MEGASGTSELEVNKERFAMLKQEHQRLTYEIKKRDLLNFSSNTKIQQQIKHQWVKLEDLKRQKSELTLQLRLHDSQSFANKSNRNLERFMKLLDDMIKLEEHVKKQTEELEKYSHKITDLDKKIKQKQKSIVKSSRNKDRVLKFQNNVSFLQNRLDASLTKYNQLVIENNALREDIRSILQTQSTFRKQYSHIKHLISLGKKTISEVVHAATMSYQTGESVKYKHNVLKERTMVDQKKLEEKIKELQLLIEQDKQLKAFIDFKKKDRGMLSESEEIESKKDQLLEEKLQDCHALMARIQMAAGCKDLNRICKTYAQQEEMNTSLFEKVNALNVETEKLQEEVSAERNNLEALSRQIKEQKRKDAAEKNDIEAGTDKYRAEAQDLEDLADAKAEELEHVKKALQHIFTLLDDVSSQQVTFTVDKAVTDDNILLYLEALEKRVLDLIDCQCYIDKKQAYYYCEE